MPPEPSPPSAHAPRSREKGGIGPFQLIGLGLLLMFVLFFLIFLVWSLFTSA
jgi:hypothetical protein